MDLGMPREELQAQRAVLLPDRIEMRRHKKRRCRGNPRLEFVQCPQLSPDYPPTWSLDGIECGVRNTAC